MVPTAINDVTASAVPPMLAKPTGDDEIAALKELMRRSVLTLLALPDPDRRYLRLAGADWLLVRDAAEAYGWTPEIIAFRPTPHDVQIYLDVLSWLSWYRRTHDAGTVRLFIAWATGASWRRLSFQFSSSERTLRRWMDDMCTTILNAFRTEAQKFFVDSCPECPAKRESTVYDDTVSSLHSTSWNAGGTQPSADLSIPAVAADREKLIERLQRQNRRRTKRRR